MGWFRSDFFNRWFVRWFKEDGTPPTPNIAADIILCAPVYHNASAMPYFTVTAPLYANINTIPYDVIHAKKYNNVTAEKP